MSITYIPAKMRRSVRLRAENRCEYCGIHEDDTEFGCEVDHIISEKHLGKTVLDNLALACFFCNRNKGSDLGSIRSTDDPVFIRFFNPRTDVWTDHFEDDSNRRILPKSDIGQVTARIFGFNAENRLLERQALLDES
jgi:hypothetical protein